MDHRPDTNSAAGTLTEQPLAVPGLGILRVQGKDAGSFLQGQLCNDVRLLHPQQGQLTALSDAKGRLLAIAYALSPAPDTIDLILPRELTDTVSAMLTRYVLRAKLTIENASDSVQFGSLSGEAAAVWLAARQIDASSLSPMEVADVTDSRVLRLHGTDNDFLLVQCGGAQDDDGIDGTWELRRIRAGEPAIFTATQGLFVAQMTNLDLLDGISFSKGCYTGQEVIARTQHLGRIKRRMLRFRATGRIVPTAGTALTADEQRVGTVVRAAAAGAGIELLAVVRLDARVGEILLADRDDGVLEPLPLPYPVPEY